MQLTITNKTLDNIDSFVYQYLPRYINNIFEKGINKKRLQAFDKLYKINSYQILNRALKNLLITKNGNNQYNIKINNVIKIDDRYIDYYIKLINYGSRDIKGYPFIRNLFNYIKDNINKIYKEWEDGNSLLW